MNWFKSFFSILLISVTLSSQGQAVASYDVLIVGGGASGVSAALQAARLGSKVLVVEETSWLGGMLTAAGVSAIDGNHRMPSGIWGEFRAELYAYYGGPKAVETGWVSNTLFEPSVGNRLLKKMVGAEKNIAVWYKSTLLDLKKQPKGWTVAIEQEGKKKTVNASILVDATELGDLLPRAGVAYSIGMDSRYDTKEEFAPEKANSIIQDLTYVAILKDYGADPKRLLKKPQGYDPKEFEHACDVKDPASHSNTPIINCDQMITYGKLPNGKYMINWPKDGNDIYLNIIEMSPKARAVELQKAKDHTLRFVYHLQSQLGFKNLGLADDEYDTADRLPFIAYHRESRRAKGLVQLTLPYVQSPYQQELPLYRTGGIVGDYTIDHHHLKNPDAPKIDFVKIRVPSYNVPLGSLIPEKIADFIVAEKSISVSNIVAGATRLQPVVLGIGQAAGVLAALSAKQAVTPKDLSLREVQQVLLDHHAYLMPFIDVDPKDSRFQAIQRVGATGILKGKGVPYKWANQTWFYPEHRISEVDLIDGMRSYYPSADKVAGSGADVTAEFFAALLLQVDPTLNKDKIRSVIAAKENQVLTRAQVAVVLDLILKPFERPVDFTGQFIATKN